MENEKNQNYGGKDDRMHFKFGKGAVDHVENKPGFSLDEY